MRATDAAACLDSALSAICVYAFTASAFLRVADSNLSFNLDLRHGSTLRVMPD
jgi:hypothetical protein